jgi:hypothetical protein
MALPFADEFDAQRTPTAPASPSRLPFAEEFERTRQKAFYADGQPLPAPAPAPTPEPAPRPAPTLDLSGAPRPGGAPRLAEVEAAMDGADPAKKASMAGRLFDFAMPGRGRGIPERTIAQANEALDSPERPVAAPPNRGLNLGGILPPRTAPAVLREDISRPATLARANNDTVLYPKGYDDSIDAGLIGAGEGVLSLFPFNGFTSPVELAPAPDAPLSGPVRFAAPIVRGAGAVTLGSLVGGPVGAGVAASANEATQISRERALKENPEAQSFNPAESLDDIATSPLKAARVAASGLFTYGGGVLARRWGAQAASEVAQGVERALAEQSKLPAIKALLGATAKTAAKEAAYNLPTSMGQAALALADQGLDPSDPAQRERIISELARTGLTTLAAQLVGTAAGVPGTARRGVAEYLSGKQRVPVAAADAAQARAANTPPKGPVVDLERSGPGEYGRPGAASPEAPGVPSAPAIVVPEPSAPPAARPALDLSGSGSPPAPAVDWTATQTRPSLDLSGAAPAVKPGLRTEQEQSAPVEVEAEPFIASIPDVLGKATNPIPPELAMRDRAEGLAPGADSPVTMKFKDIHQAQQWVDANQDRISKRNTTIIDIKGKGATLTYYPKPSSSIIDIPYQESSDARAPQSQVPAPVAPRPAPVREPQAALPAADERQVKPNNPAIPESSTVKDSLPVQGAQRAPSPTESEVIPNGQNEAEKGRQEGLLTGEKTQAAKDGPATGTTRPAPATAESAPKEPWAMTREEFDSVRPAVEGYLYHGSPDGDIKEFDPYGHTQPWKEGQGPYATDNRDIAAEYAQGRTARGERREASKTSGKINYVKSDAVNVLDLDTPVNRELWDRAANDLGAPRISEATTNYEAMQELRQNLAEDQGFTDAYYAVEEWLREKGGFDATRHTEGKIRGVQHKVTVFKGDVGTQDGVPYSTMKGRVIPALDVHRETVQRAAEQGKPVPRAVLESYRGEPWADAALAKLEESASEAPVTPEVAAPKPQSGDQYSSLNDEALRRAAGKSKQNDQMITLYRAESNPKDRIEPAEWIKTQPSYQRTQEASGRWFTDDLEEAQWYIDNEYPGGRIVSVQIPRSDVEKYRVSKIALKEGNKNASENPAAFSRRPEKEFFLPKEISLKATEYKPQSFVAAEPTTTPAEASPQGEAKANAAPNAPNSPGNGAPNGPIGANGAELEGNSAQLPKPGASDNAEISAPARQRAEAETESAAPAAPASPAATPTPEAAPKGSAPANGQASTPVQPPPAPAGGSGTAPSPDGDGDAVGPKRAMIDARRKRLLLADIPSPERKSWQEALESAIEQGIPERAGQIALDVLESSRALSDVETAGLTYHLAGIVNRHDDALKVLNDPAASEADRMDAAAAVERALEDYDTASRALRMSGTEKGRALAAQKLMMDRSYQLLPLLAQAGEAKGKALSPKERAAFEKLAAEHEQAQAEVERLKALLEKKELGRAVAQNKAKAAKPKASLEERLARARELMKAGCLID